MSALQVPAPQSDRERIDAMVAAYRDSIERLYEMAYIQGQIDLANETREQLCKAAP